LLAHSVHGAPLRWPIKRYESSGCSSRPTEPRPPAAATWHDCWRDVHGPDRRTANHAANAKRRGRQSGAHPRRGHDRGPRDGNGCRCPPSRRVPVSALAPSTVTIRRAPPLGGAHAALLRACPAARPGRCAQRRSGSGDAPALPGRDHRGSDELILPLHGGPVIDDEQIPALRVEIRSLLEQVLAPRRRDGTIRRTSRLLT